MKKKTWTAKDAEQLKTLGDQMRGLLSNPGQHGPHFGQLHQPLFDRYIALLEKFNQCDATWHALQKQREQQRGNQRD